MPPWAPEMVSQAGQSQLTTTIDRQGIDCHLVWPYYLSIAHGMNGSLQAIKLNHTHAMMHYAFCGHPLLLKQRIVGRAIAIVLLLHVTSHSQATTDFLLMYDRNWLSRFSDVV